MSWTLLKTLLNACRVQMLDMLRGHQNHLHASRLEWIVIWLIVVEVFVGLLELLGLFGLLGRR